MDSINVYWGSDEEFEQAVKDLKDIFFLADIVSHINKAEMSINGISKTDEPPMEVENLIIHTDDYGGIKEWALLGFSNNILQNLKVKIANLWICNPPKKIYEDIINNYDNDIIQEHKTEYPEITMDHMKKMSEGFENVVIGQSHVMRLALSSIYALKSKIRKRPVTLLFLGDSGVGKTETAKYISLCIGKEMVRVQFSMQQTSSAYQYIFGADHGEDSLARELIRRKSNVILLDEFDKVSPAFYNAFYQMFDEGIFVDANYSVDISKSIIICTTNYKTPEEAEKNLGTPIYSRFSKIINFKPISADDKVLIAKKWYDNIMESIDPEDKKLIENNNVLQFYESHIRRGSYSNMRMLKNDIEDSVAFEILKAHGILR